MLTADADVPFSSLSRVDNRSSSSTAVWKLFSTEPMPRAWLEMLFERDFRVVANVTWAAYPR